MRNLLMINHMFPPFNGVGVIRVAKFASYLPEFDWQPTILTCRRPYDIQDSLDNVFLSQLPESVDIHRVYCPSFYEIYRLMGGQVKQGSFGLSGSRMFSFVRSLFVPDPYIGWYITGFREAKHILQSQKVDAVLTSSPRETTHLIGLSLKRKYGIPWIADFRDPWIKKQHRPKRIRVLDRVDCRLQQQVLKAADRVTVAWPGIAEGFKQYLPEISKKTEILTNGYDPHDFNGVVSQRFSKFTLLFAGALYRELACEPLFQALNLLVRNSPQQALELQVIILGRCDEHTHRMIEKYELQTCVELVYQKPHRECLSYILGADLLFFSVPDHFWIPSKIFEYLKSNRPILAIADCESDAVKFIRNVRPCVASRSPDKIARVISDMVSQRRTNTNRYLDCQMREGPISRFERRYLTGKLAQILYDVSEKT